MNTSGHEAHQTTDTSCRRHTRKWMHQTIQHIRQWTIYGQGQIRPYNTSDNGPFTAKDRSDHTTHQTMDHLQPRTHQTIQHIRQWTIYSQGQTRPYNTSDSGPFMAKDASDHTTHQTMDHLWPRTNQTIQHIRQWTIYSQGCLWPGTHQTMATADHGLIRSQRHLTIHTLTVDTFG